MIYSRSLQVDIEGSFAHKAVVAFASLVHDAVFIMVPEMLELSFLYQLELALIQHIFVLPVGHGNKIAAEVGGAQVDPDSSSPQHVVNQPYVP